MATGLALAACSDSNENAGQPDDTGAAGEQPGAETAETQVPGEGVNPDAAPELLEEAAVPPSAWNIDNALAAEPCETQPEGAPLRIGYAGMGGANAADADIAVALDHLRQLINCSGGLNGTPVELTIGDISGTAVDSRAGIRALLLDDQGEYKVDLVFGPPEHDPGLRVLVVTAKQIPVIYLGSTEPGLADLAELSYLASFDDSDSATAAAEFAREQGWARAVTVSSDGPGYGYTASVFAGVFQNSGGLLMSDLDFDPNGGTDMAALVSQISADPPDVIYSSMPADQAVDLKAQLASAGLSTALLLSDSFEKTGGYTTDLLAGAEGIYHVTHAFPSADSRPVALYNSISDNGKLASTYAYPALVADAYAVVADAWTRTDKSDPATISVAFGGAIADSADVVGASGVLTYGGDPSPTKPIYVIQLVDRKPVLVYQHEG